MWQGTDIVLHLHSAGAGGLDWVCRNAGITHNTSEPGDPQGNDIAEDFVQLVKLGTAAALCQSWLTHDYLFFGC